MTWQLANATQRVFLVQVETCLHYSQRPLNLKNPLYNMERNESR
jgi:hypothetical protein